MDRFKFEEKYLKKVQEQILNECEGEKKTLQNIPHEYKGRYAEVKWGDEDLVEHLSDIYVKRIKKLEGLEKKPYFGSFDFSILGNPLKIFHVGRTNIIKDNEILVLDWRNPICTLYYDQNIGNVSYLAPSGIISGILHNKSQILIEDGKLKKVTDADLVSSDELLQPYLDVNADSRMKTIIASIQHEQNRIIRIPFNQNIIVQGVAGSGKTSVALHRIAYLLYNNRNNVTPDECAILGPNKYFLKYISSVLPELDAESIKEYTFEELSKNIIGSSKYSYETSNEEMRRYLSTKNKFDCIEKIKGTLEYKNALNKFICDYFNGCLQEGIFFENIQIIDSEFLKNNLKFTIGYSYKIEHFIKNFIKKMKENCEDIYYDLSRPLIAEMKKYPLRSEERKNVISRLDQLKDMIYDGCAKELKKYIKPLLIEPIDLYKKFIENIEKYIEINDYDVDRFKKSTLKMLKKKVIPYSDLAAITYLYLQYNDKSSFSKFKHLIIDEAQDYNLFQYYVINTLFTNSSFSIFGDLAQSVYLYRTIDSWENLNHMIFNNSCQLIKMDKSYRTTKEITKTSNLILNQIGLNKAEPVIRTGPDVKIEEIKETNAVNCYLKAINEFINNGYKSIALICKTEDEVEYVSKIMEELHFKFSVIRSSTLDYAGGINILTSYFAKGLEFDGVIICNASEEKYDHNSSIDMHLMYVAMTRSLHQLKIFYYDELTKPLNNENIKVKKLNKKI